MKKICYFNDLSIGGQYFDGNQCVDFCPQGQQANPINGYMCQVANQGQEVNCSLTKQNCIGCATDQFSVLQFQFNTNTQQCYVQDCQTKNVISLSGWICNSCRQAQGSGNIPQGQYYDGKTCVDSCPNGLSASLDTQFVCSPPPNPGKSVGCSNDSKTCQGCLFTLDYVRLFTYQSDNNCSVKDCNSIIMTPFLNGFVCNSCSQASGNGNFPKGQYFDGKTCVTECPPGYTASAKTNYICQKNVQCSQDQSTCAGCGDTTAIQQLFTYVNGNTCVVSDCSGSKIAKKLNGYVCQSCSTTSGFDGFPTGSYYDGNTCVNACGKGLAASQATKYTCQLQFPGNPVNCASDPSNCEGCGQTSDIQNLFTYSKGACIATDCSALIIGSNLNGWICNSCQNVTGPGIITQGQYFDGTKCVTSCPAGTSASESTGFACLYPANPGSAVACSSDSSTCGGCGKTKLLQKLFTHGNGNNCSVVDCNQMVVGSNLNGWVCNSCSQASGDHNIAKGQYYNGSTCVNSCPPGQYANAATGYVCQNPNPGTPVACSKDSSTCGGCGSTAAIEKLFTHGTGNKCSISDCTASVIGSNLNGWVCNSCSAATGNGNISTGQYFNGTTCVASCPNGQSASEATGFECKANSGPAPVNNNASQSSLIGYTLIFTILKILV
ncbi:hypothetical protein ABPG73_002857 [Tetrahymena malaccensis]